MIRNLTWGCGCHLDATVSPGTLVNKLIFNNGDSVYTPGTTYPITIQISKAGIKRFGFQVTVLKSSDNSYVGTLIVRDTVRTQTAIGVAPNLSRKYITHKAKGAAAVSTGLGEWTFEWQAPSINVGAVKFYYATNATNMDNQNTGDQVYLSSFEIKPKTAIGVEEETKSAFFNAYYSSTSKQLFISYDNVPLGKAKIEIRDIEGRLIQTDELNNSGTLVKDQEINLNPNISSGIYLITYRKENIMLSKKIYVYH